MAEATLRLEFGSDGFAVIQMINGENRFRTSTIKEWNVVLDKVIENGEVKGLLITGSGRFFSNGIDVAWLSQRNPEETNVQDYLAQLSALMMRILALPMPTVALMNGHTFGGGAFLALVCDFRLMLPDRGWLCWPETAMGLPIPGPLMQIARAKIPQGAPQRESILLSTRLTASVAKSLGLIDGIIEESQMVDAGKALLKASLGRNGLGREIVQQVKKDLYSHVVDFSKL